MTARTMHSATETSVARAIADAQEIAASRERMTSSLLGRERTITLLLAGGFLGAALASAVLISSPTPFTPWVAALSVLLYAAISQVEFEVGPGSAVPTQLALVPMLFLLPIGAVPLFVAAGLVLGGVLERLRSRRHQDRLPVLLCSSWHSIGPAVTVGVFAPGPPEWKHLPVYIAALGAQFALDFAAVVVRHRFGRRMRVSALVSPLGWVALVDASLAPVALLVAFVAASEPAAIAGILPLAGLLHLLGADRRRRLDESIQLGREVEHASRAARADPLTGVGNRLAWQEAVESASVLYEREARGSSFVLVDLNGLKETNDTHGHDVGDRLIQALAGALQAAIPYHATLARIGGDEFAVLAVGADEQTGSAIAAGIRRQLRGLSAGRVPVRASIGAASCPPAETFDDALRLADERLYDDKTATTARDP